MLRSPSVRERSSIQRLLQVVTNFAQPAASDARGGDTQRRERHYAALIAAIVATSGKIRLDSVHLCDSSHRASPTSPRLERGMTSGLGQKSFRDFCAHCGLHAEWCFAVDPRSRGKLRFFSVALGRHCSACDTCNEVVPAHKEFSRAKQTPVPLIL